MAERQLTDLPVNSAPLDSDLYHTRQGAVDRRMTGTTLKQFTRGISVYDNSFPYLRSMSVVGSDGEIYVAAKDTVGNSPTVDDGTNWYSPTLRSGYAVGDLVFATTDTARAGTFSLDGSTIVNGVNLYPALAASGSRFITVNGNNLILKNAEDFIRGKGASGRVVGQFESDAIRDIQGYFGAWSGQSDVSGQVSGAFEFGGTTARHSQPVDGAGRAVEFIASNVVPTASENRPKSLTALICIYHGVY